MIAYVDSTPVVVTDTSIDIPMPDDVVVDDALVTFVAVDGSATITAPAGWTQQATATDGSTLRLESFTKIAEAADPGTFTFTLSASSDAAAVMLAYRSVDTTNPVNQSAGDFTASTTSITAPSVTVTEEDTQLVIAWATEQDSAVITPDVDVDITYHDIGANIRLVIADQARGRDEATGNRVATSDLTGSAAGIQLALALAEAAVVGFTDNHKAKLARLSVPPLFDNRLNSNFGKLVSVIGTGDNAIGGLPVEEEVLPDDSPDPDPPRTLVGGGAQFVETE